jgi:hypothetical protein
MVGKASYYQSANAGMPFNPWIFGGMLPYLSSIKKNEVYKDKHISKILLVLK